MIGLQKNYRILYHQNYHLIEKPNNHFLKSRCISEFSWNYLKNTNAQVLSSGIAFLAGVGGRVPDMFLMSSHV